MNVLSLFDGMSCGRIALERAGIPITNYFASEIDKYAITVAQANCPDTIQLGDITKLDVEALPPIDLVIGGSPCQGFSFAGKQEAFDDPRSKLFFDYCKVMGRAAKKNPNIKFLLENVKMKKENLAVISGILNVEPIFINSALVSAQNRQRYYWTNFTDIKQPADRGIVLADILENEGTGWIKNKGEWCSRNEKGMCLDANYFKGVDNHGQRTMIAKLKKINPRVEGISVDRDGVRPHRGDARKSGLSEMGRVLFKGAEKTYTVTAAHAPKVFEGEGFRKLTPVECERLQTVPDNYTNHVSNTQRYKMLGNGWTVDVIAHIFRGLK